MLPARLERRPRRRVILTSCPMSTSMSLSGSSPAQPPAPSGGDVAVVVGAEQVDAVREAARPCRGSRPRRRRSRCARRWPDQHPVLVVAEVGGAHPDGAVGVEHVALRAQALRCSATTVPPVVERALGEPDVEVDVERVELACARRAASRTPASRTVTGSSRSSTSRGWAGDDAAASRRCSRRGSRPRAPARPSAAAAIEAPKRSIWVPASLM